VDDARPLDAADPGQARAAMGQQRVDEGAVGIAGRGMDHEPRRLVEHQQVRVLIDDGEIHRLRQRRIGDRLGQGEEEALSRLDPHRWVGYRRSVQGHAAVLDEMLDARPRQLGKARRQQAIEPLSGVAGLGGDPPDAARHLART
jgi:hypothetical protein